jgi:N-acetylglucosamine malate deacetylase 1
MAGRVFAVAAHPDDIEFQMAGTLILLGEAGYEIHYMNIANGCCGSATLGAEEIAQIRCEEAQSAAELIGAVYHPSLTDDLNIFYEPGLLARMSSIMRDVAPDIVLTHSPQDYMEDHQNAARLAAGAAFTRGIPNYRTDPHMDSVDHPVTVYHAQPHGNRDPLGERVVPDIYVDITEVIEKKTQMLACHASQKSWLDHSQGLGAYLDAMRAMSAEVGEMSGRFSIAEGWRRRLHLGFCGEKDNPLVTALEGTIHRR